MSEIKSRKETEEALKESERLLRLMADSLPVLISYVDTERRYRFANRTYERYVGIAGTEISGRFVKDILGVEAYNSISLNMDKALAGEEITFERVFNFEKSGETFLRVNYVPDFGEHGRVRGFFVLGYDITGHKKTERLLRRYARHISGMEDMQNKKLAMELHDRIGPNLTALGINMNIVRNRLADADSDTVSRLDESLGLLEQTGEYVRDMMSELLPPLLDDQGLYAALRWYGKKFSQRLGAAVEVSSGALAPRLPLNIEHALFRVVQEALNNIAKHAKASQVTVRLESLDQVLRLVIEDNGVGFDGELVNKEEGARGLGLLSMAERADAIGGTLRVVSVPGQGTRVSVEVPF